ncbi:MAG: HlyC/CorC family transporter [Ignavibacteriaceae bacterium]|nr:HlyC/CorC family transporter [Ignavibacteriaceae bacterium]
MGSELLLLGILILLSAFFSATEIAYIKANKLKLEIRARKNSSPAKNGLFFIRNPETFFSTVLIGNNIANITYASLSAIILADLFGFNELQILLVSTLIILFFGELLPKYLSGELPDLFILLASVPMRFVSFVLWPLVQATSWVTHKLTSRAAFTTDNYVDYFLKEDLEYLVKESEEAGTVQKKDTMLIQKVIEMNEQRVSEVMRPRMEITGIDISATIDEALDMFIESGFSKLPVYDEDLDNIKGFILSYDLFRRPDSIKSITREAVFVPESKKSIDLLNELLYRRTSLAIVIDEFGGTAGIVTTEDLMEELFGEIKDELDVEENIMRKIRDDEFLLSGKVEIDHINETYNMGLPEGDYLTVAGFIIHECGRIPETNEIIKIGKFSMQIIRTDGRKIDMVRLRIESDE